MGSARGTNKKNKPSSKLSPKNMWEKLSGTKTQPPLTVKSDAAGDDVVVVDPTNPYDYAEGIGEILITNPDSLDHFDLKIVPDTLAKQDTIAFTESAKLIVQAKDKDNKDINLDENKLLKFSVNSNVRYGTFINKNGDTLRTTPVVLNDIEYRDAKAGLIK
ncbi:MAG: hypothetical protein P8X42_09820, partial [Calditrichaceae bacterium]